MVQVYIYFYIGDALRGRCKFKEALIFYEKALDLDSINE